MPAPFFHAGKWGVDPGIKEPTLNGQSFRCQQRCPNPGFPFLEVLPVTDQVEIEGVVI